MNCAITWSSLTSVFALDSQDPDAELVLYIVQSRLANSSRAEQPLRLRGVAWNLNVYNAMCKLRCTLGATGHRPVRAGTRRARKVGDGDECRPPSLFNDADPESSNRALQLLPMSMSTRRASCTLPGSVASFPEISSALPCSSIMHVSP